MIAFIVYFVLSIIMGIALLFVSLFNYKIRANYYNSHKQFFKLWQLLKGIKNSNKQVLMFHAASAGEYEQIQPILRGIDRTKYFIVQTLTSPSIYNVEKNTKLYDVKCYHPFDVIWLSYLFFKITNPEKYIITRHDLWPGHILMANYFKIPIYYINANIHQNSIWYKKPLRFLSRYFFNKVNYFVVPSQYIAGNLKDICPTARFIISQDTRFNQVFHKLKHPPSLVYDLLKKMYPNSDQVMVFGSIDKGDEKLLNNLPTLAENKKIILIPHKVDAKTIDRIEKKILSINLSFLKFSDLIKQYNKNTTFAGQITNYVNDTVGYTKETPATWRTLFNYEMHTPDILLVDTIGLLTYLYSLGSYAYVGGGFTRGVHSVLEPAVYGCQIACGPNIEMLDEAKFLKNKDKLSIINDKVDLITFAKKTNDSPPTYLPNTSSVATEMIQLIVDYTSWKTVLGIEFHEA